MKRIGSVVLGAAAMMVFGALPASADERKFTYSNEAKTLPASTFELEQWVTVQARREEGTYRVWKFREELEYGFSDRFTGAAYLNWEAKTIDDVPGESDLHDATFAGISLEGKYKFTDPSADPVGLLLYAEVTAEHDEYELELKAVASKSWGSWTFAGNFILEVEWAGAIDPATGRRAWEHETVLEATAGVSYSLLPPLSIGVEGVTRTPFTGSFEHREQTAYFIGPNAHLATGPFWATLTVLFQVDPQGHNDLNLDDFTKYEVRLIFGISF